MWAFLFLTIFGRCVRFPNPHVSSPCESLFLQVVLDELALGYAGKRDRWNGYDANEHKRVVEKYEHAEAERRRIREAERNAAYLKKKEEKAKAKEERARKRAEAAAKGEHAEGAEGEDSPSESDSHSDSDSDSDSDAGSSDSDDDVREKDSQEVAGQELKTYNTKVCVLPASPRACVHVCVHECGCACASVERCDAWGW